MIAVAQPDSLVLDACGDIDCSPPTFASEGLLNSISQNSTDLERGWFSSTSCHRISHAEVMAVYCAPTCLHSHPQSATLPALLRVISLPVASQSVFIASTGRDQRETSEVRLYVLLRPMITWSLGFALLSASFGPATPGRG